MTRGILVRTMHRLPHHQSLAPLRWTVRAVGDLSVVPDAIRSRVIPATVPGCIHTDLIDAGLIRDPRVGDAESEVQWVSWTDWRNELEFDAEPALFERDEIDLVFDHLDTIASIELNGVEVGRAVSEFLPWRFPVREVLRPGRNHLGVTFTSPLRYVKEEAARLGPRPVNGDYPAYNMIRKCASNFEWDWGPRVATCGLAGDVRLEAWSIARITHVVPRWEDPTRCRLSVNMEVAPRGRSSSFEVLVTALPGSPSPVRVAKQPEGVRVSALTTLEVDVGAAPAQGWAPTGHGSQTMRSMRITLSADNAAVSEWRGATPYRDVRFDRESCTLILNNRPVYCRGANWIPEGLFPRDRTPERVRERLQQLKAANMNMIRVWGGGRYEPDWFYDLCDELGIMVWQDFMFACACYPEEEPIRSLVEKEARYHVARLSQHPSVVLWCGGNECIWAHESWGFKEKLAPGQTWGEKYYRELLPRICAEVNPSVPYIPNSPFSPKVGLHPNDPSNGDTHTWDVWGEGYRTVTPRFCSEFGQQGPSNIETLKAAGLVPAPGETAAVPARLAARQRGPGGNTRWYDDPIAAWFRPPRDFDEWHFLAQLVQARSLQIGIEWQRANMPMCMGSLIWQLNDAWPGLSWSLLGPDGRPKLAYHAVQRAFADRLLTIQPFDGRPWLVAVNDTDEPWEHPLVVRRCTFDGSVLAESRAGTSLLVRPREARRVGPIETFVGLPGDPSREVVLAQAHSVDEPAHWFAAPDRELRYPEPRFRLDGIESKADPGHLAGIVLRAESMIRDAVVTIPRPDGACVIRAARPLLMPGESCRMIVVSREPQPADVIDGSGAAIMCANHFGKPPT